MIKKYLLIARENIIGISDDEGLKALNGYVVNQSGNGSLIETIFMRNEK